MVSWSNILLLGALGAVALVLIAGFANMFRGGNSALSQNLMRWRVGLQFLALLIVMAILYLRQ
jgi:hypothetical protein